MSAIAIVDEKTAATLPQLPPSDEIDCCRPAPVKSPSESAEAYPRVVVVLDAKTRVIECAAGIQWIVQRRVNSSPQPWRGRSFCRTKAALLRIAGHHPALEALPDWFPERAAA
jgi:hypothetical protein